VWKFSALMLWLLSETIMAAPPARQATTSPASAWGEAVQGMQMSISIARSEVAIGDRIDLLIRVRNRSGKRWLLLWSGQSETSYRIEVTRASDGHSVPVTEAGRLDPFHSWTIPLEPGQVVEQHLCLNSLRDMTIAQTYRVQLQGSFGEADPGSGALFSSNIIEVHVFEQPDPRPVVLDGE